MFKIWDFVISTVMSLDCQCTDFGSKGLVGEARRSQGRGRYLESYEIFVCSGRAQMFMEFKAPDRDYSRMLCCISEIYNV